MRQLMWCINKPCPAYHIKFDTDRTHCVACDLALQPYDYQRDDPMGRDTPPAPDEPTRPKLLLAAGEPEPAVFSVDCDVAGCPVAPTAKVLMPFKLYTSCLYLANAIGVEWIAYLKGHETKNGAIKMTDIYFPNQRANGVHVDAEVMTKMQPGTIGSIHSHVEMQAYFSAEDKAHFNHPCDMIINRGGKVDAVIRKRLDCGRYQRVQAKVILLGTQADVGLLDQLKAKLTVEPIIQSSSYQGRYQGQGKIVPTDNRSTRGHDYRIPSEREEHYYRMGKSGKFERVEDDDAHLPYKGSDGRIWNGREWEDLREEMDAQH